MARRLPVYLLLDTSSSMKGKSIESLKVGIEAMVSALKMDYVILECAVLSIISFDRVVNEILPLTELEGLVLPEIKANESSLSNFGMALEFLYQKCDQELVRSTELKKGDWKPLLFLFSAQKPNDMAKYLEFIPKVKSIGFSHIISCAAGSKASPKTLKLLSNNVVQLSNSDIQTYRQLFKWVSEIICTSPKRIADAEISGCVNSL